MSPKPCARPNQVDFTFQVITVIKIFPSYSPYLMVSPRFKQSLHLLDLSVVSPAPAKRYVMTSKSIEFHALLVGKSAVNES